MLKSMPINNIHYVFLVKEPQQPSITTYQSGALIHDGINYLMNYSKRPSFLTQRHGLFLPNQRGFLPHRPWLIHEGQLRFRKGIRLRRPSVSTSRADIFLCRWKWA